MGEGHLHGANTEYLTMLTRVFLHLANEEYQTTLGSRYLLLHFVLYVGERYIERDRNFFTVSRARETMSTLPGPPQLPPSICIPVVRFPNCLPDSTR